MTEVTSDSLEKVRDVVVEMLGTEREKITTDADFADDLECDSLDMVELIMEFEERYNIEVRDDEAEAVKTVADAVALLDRKLGDKSVATI